MAKLDNSKPSTCFLKVSGYLRSYMQSKYGNPVFFPSNSTAYTLMSRFLVDNPGFKKLSDFSYSSASFHSQEANSLFSVNIKFPSNEEKKKFLEIGMPFEVYRKGRMISTTSTFELSIPGAKALRNEIKRMFWIDFSRFYDECVFRAGRMGECVSAEDSMSDFMIVYNIDMAEFETLMRYWRRWRTRMKEEIEAKRTAWEKATGNIMVYTP